MKETVAVRVDDKGRITIPLKIRQELNIKAGDVFFMLPEKTGFLLAKVENPFDILTKHAREEARQGKTIPFEEFAKDYINSRREKPFAKKARGKEPSGNSDDYPKVTQKEIDRSVSRIGLKPASRKRKKGD